MRALITGANGFIGTHLARALLERGDQVTGLVRSASRAEHLRELGIELAQGDVTDVDSLRSAVASADVVYHLAGLVRAFSYEEFQSVNEHGVRNLAAACARRTTPPVLVVVSSLAAAGPAPGGHPRTEDDPPTPISSYGRSKRAGEIVAEDFADRVPTSIVRPPIVFGERDPGMLELFRMIRRGGIHAVPGFSTRRFSLLYGDDLAEVLIQTAVRGRRLPASTAARDERSTEGYYYAADDEQLTYEQIGERIGCALGLKRVRIVHVPKAVALCAAACSEFVSWALSKPTFFNVDKIREATAGSWICSSERARRDLGFAVRLPLLERMRQTAEWYQRQGWS